MKEANEILSPIFHYLLKADWQGVDIEDEEKWKLWDFSVPEVRKWNLQLNFTT